MSPLGAWIVLPAGTASSSRLRTLGLVNSPRSITSQLPRRDEKTLRRSEEHTSELQSLMRISYAVFCLQKKKAKYKHKSRQTDYMSARDHASEQHYHTRL